MTEKPRGQQPIDYLGERKEVQTFLDSIAHWIEVYSAAEWERESLITEYKAIDESDEALTFTGQNKLKAIENVLFHKFGLSRSEALK